MESTTHIRSFTSRSNLQGRTPYEILTRETPDIMEYLDFHFFQLVKYYESTTFPNQHEYLGRRLGLAHKVGQAMCYWILKENGQVIA